MTLTTDFGMGSAYVAAVKGALWSVAPQAQVVDLTHSIPPQDVRACGLFLRDVLHCYPPGSIHVVVVDPGVGSDRAILLAEWRGQMILAPDNGCWTPIGDADARVWRMTQPRFWRHPVSATFHGRDIFAPVAGHLCNGAKPSELGEPAATWIRLGLPQPRITESAVVGEVLIVDSFGNLITNIPAEHSGSVSINGVNLGRPLHTYSEKRPGELVALVSSSGFVEIAEVNGSAAARLGVGVGAIVEVQTKG